MNNVCLLFCPSSSFTGSFPNGPTESFSTLKSRVPKANPKRVGSFWVCSGRWLPKRSRTFDHSVYATRALGSSRESHCATKARPFIGSVEYTYIYMCVCVCTLCCCGSFRYSFILPICPMLHGQPLTIVLPSCLLVVITHKLYPSIHLYVYSCLHFSLFVVSMYSPEFHDPGR